MPGSDVRLTGLTTVLDEVPVLHRCTLAVEAGTITVLMGPSGGGKTTLVRHLSGLLAPGDGTVVVDGTDVWAADPRALRALRRRMSVMLGGPSLFESSLFASLSALENLTYGLDTRGVPAARRDDVAMARLDELGLADRATELPAALPAHGRKRLALARALVVDAPLLVLDDIETGLDSVHRARILTALRRQHERTGCTMIITTHDVGLARDLGGTLAVLCHGRIVARGSAAELLAGVDSGAEFDRRFRVNDLVGPPRISDLPTDERTFSLDENVLWTALIGLVLVAALAALLALGPPLPLPF